MMSLPLPALEQAAHEPASLSVLWPRSSYQARLSIILVVECLDDLVRAEVTMHISSSDANERASHLREYLG